MAKYIKGKDGKFKGSIGSGATNVPQAPSRPSSSDSPYPRPNPSSSELTAAKDWIRAAERNAYRHFEKAHMHEDNGDKDKARSSWEQYAKWDKERQDRYAEMLRFYGPNNI